MILFMNSIKRSLLLILWRRLEAAATSLLGEPTIKKKKVFGECRWSHMTAAGWVQPSTDGSDWSSLKVIVET